jgi:hypothetical protein
MSEVKSCEFRSSGPRNNHAAITAAEADSCRHPGFPGLDGPPSARRCRSAASSSAYEGKKRCPSRLEENMLLRPSFVAALATLLPPWPLFALTDADAGKIAEGIGSLAPSVIYAGLIVAAAVLLAGVVRTYGESPAPVGRFQLGAGAAGQDRVLDTRTGRLWERTSSSGEWVVVPVPWQLKRGKG